MVTERERRSVIAHSSAANNFKNYGGNYRVLPLRVLLLIFREVLSQRTQVFSYQLQALAQFGGGGHILRGVDYEFLEGNHRRVVSNVPLHF
ncbi:MAG TPA: hypothetical protein VN957_15400 [Chthoniobacterales bacterium]|jgi:hypothetical protein|nr:hypothetical protein [Chthoniobacterales bacterium]